MLSNYIAKCILAFLQTLAFYLTYFLVSLLPLLVLNLLWSCIPSKPSQMSLKQTFHNIKLIKEKKHKQNNLDQCNLPASSFRKISLVSQIASRTAVCHHAPNACPLLHLRRYSLKGEMDENFLRIMTSQTYLPN